MRCGTRPPYPVGHDGRHPHPERRRPEDGKAPLFPDLGHPHRQYPDRGLARLRHLFQAWPEDPTITFDQGEGLTAGTSQVKHRDVQLGTVTAIQLTPDMNHVRVTAQMTRDASPLITGNTKFWIVRPRFFAGSLSGLGTLLSGPYIDLMPAPGGGPVQTAFTGLPGPARPAVPSSPAAFSCSRRTG